METIEYLETHGSRKLMSTFTYINIHISCVYTCAPRSARKAVHLELRVEEQNVEEVRQPVTAGF